MQMLFRANWMRWLTLAGFVIATSTVALVGYRTYRSFQLLQSAYEAGAPKTSSVRGWMTLGYVAVTYGVSVAQLGAGLGLTEPFDADRNLKSLAEAAREPPPQFVQRTQRVIAAHAPEAAAGASIPPSGWLAMIDEQVLTSLLVYGYAMLGLILLLGAIGLPLPSGFAMTLVGSLAAQGRMEWIFAGTVAVCASVAGDTIGYVLGRLLGHDIIEQHGHWIGVTPERQTRIHTFFGRWGMLTVFITRTFVSYLSSVANLLAGVSRLGAIGFIAIATAGRLLWGAAYLGLGYAIGADLEAATSFLTNVSFLMLALSAAGGSGLLVFRSSRASI